MYILIAILLIVLDLFLLVFFSSFLLFFFLVFWWLSLLLCLDCFFFFVCISCRFLVFSYHGSFDIEAYTYIHIYVYIFMTVLSWCSFNCKCISSILYLYLSFLTIFGFGSKFVCGGFPTFTAWMPLLVSLIVCIICMCVYTYICIHVYIYMSF